MPADAASDPSPSASLVSASSIDGLVLRRAGLAAAAVGILATVLAAALRGVEGAIGAAAATILVLVFFSVGQVVLGAVLRSNPQMAMTVALMTYLVKIGVLFVFIILFAETTLFDTKVFAATVVACTVAWTIAEVWVFAVTKVLYVDPAGSR
jgi:ATP synthase protein I